jgi:hypothetical protein
MTAQRYEVLAVDDLVMGYHHHTRVGGSRR